VIVLVGLFVALMIAVSSVRSVLQDRLQYRAEALAAVSESLAGPQRLTGVVLAIPYVERYQDEIVGDDKVRRNIERTVRHELLVLPESLKVSGHLDPDLRRRGLFRINGYVFAGTLRGHFLMPANASYPRDHDGAAVEPGLPRLILGVCDARGLRSVALQADGAALVVQAGTGRAAIRAGVSAPLASVPSDGARLAFEARLELGGAEGFDIVPLGKETQASLESSWPHPSFSGRFLPVERRVDAAGFEARWQTTAFASNAREAWLATVERAPQAEAPADTIDSFHLALIDPVDIYSLTDRATKYALLFIGLTLGGFALYEILRRMRVHPLQYLLVGMALVMFFLLLLALSEHLGFALAYLAAAGSCAGLIGFYVGAVLGSVRHGGLFGAGLGLLYGALYGILQSEQNALLLGSLLVFLILAAVMVATRRVDWDRLLEAGKAGG
jgi:inner membrane protein